jgi:tol-pal system protein YbgF
MKPSFFRAIRASAVVAMLIGASSAYAQESGSGFFDRIFGGSDRFSTPQDRDGQTPPAGQAQPDERAPSGGPNRVAQGPGSDPIVRIDRLEAQLRQMTGILEQLQYRNQQLEAQLRRVQEETEYRFQELRGGAPAPRTSTPARPPQGPAANPPAANPAPTTGATPGRRGDAFDPSQNPSAPGAPRTLGTTTASAPLTQSNDGEEPVGAPGGRSVGAPLDLSTLAAPNDPPGVGAPGAQLEQLPPAQPRNPGAGGQVATLPPTDSPKDNYDLAYGYILRKDYALAEDGFRSFLRRYPSDRMAPEAQYWLGESLFQRQRYRDAAETFLNVSTKFESTAKAPDALLRLGQSLAALGEKEAACASFGEVLRKYPRASVSVKQGVDREQKRVRC